MMRTRISASGFKKKGALFFAGEKADWHRKVKISQ
jgi:hypothetical protein